MVAIFETQTCSVQDYLHLETESDVRHEYRNGEIIEMAGGTPNHNRIAAGLCSILRFSLKGQPYDVFVTDQRLWIPKVKRYTYPDVMVTRDPLVLQEGRSDTVTNPIVLAEVLSKSTRDYDRGDKFQAYRSIPSAVEYLTIDQNSPHLEHWLKTDRGWLLQDIDGLDGRLTLEAIAVEIELADLYDKVDFEAES